MTSSKNVAFLAILLVTLVLTPPLTAGELTVVDDGNGGLVLSSDAVGPKPPADCRVFPLVGENVRIRKTFDLSAVSQEKLQELQNASLQIYWEVADQSVAVRKKPQKNGLTETIFVKINGHELQFSTGDELRITWHRLWKEIPFPAEWLLPTLNVVEIGKLGSVADNDDFVYVGIDTSRQPLWSENSDDQGRTFRKDWPANPKAVGEYLIRLHLAAHQTEYHVDFAKPADASKVALQGKAEIRDGKLKLSGQKDYAVLAGTEDFNITPSGLTFNVVMRQDIPREDSQKKDNNVLLGLKQRSWFVGRTKDLYNISFTQNGSSMTWNKAVVEGDFPPLETWVQQTVVFRHVHDSGRGVDGYEINVYSDGELQLRRFYDSLQPEVTIEPVLLGGNKTWKDYFFCGEIASVSLYRRPLSEEEIAGLSKGNPLLKKLPAGYNEIQPEVIQACRHEPPRMPVHKVSGSSPPCAAPPPPVSLNRKSWRFWRKPKMSLATPMISRPNGTPTPKAPSPCSKDRASCFSLSKAEPPSLLPSSASTIPSPKPMSSMDAVLAGKFSAATAMSTTLTKM